MDLKQAIKSRTISFNAIATLIIPVLPQLGVSLTPEMITAIMGIGNIILRFLTDKAVDEK